MVSDSQRQTLVSNTLSIYFTQALLYIFELLVQEYTFTRPKFQELTFLLESRDFSKFIKPEPPTMFFVNQITHSVIPRLALLPLTPLRGYAKVPFGRRNSYVSRFRRMIDNGPLVWVDCEMTGLDAMNDRIIEICCLVTDGDLNIIEEVSILIR